jgi:hypothetical protein
MSKEERARTEPRTRSRVPVDYPVSFTGDEVSGQGILMNLTIAGGEIESPVHFPIGSRLCLHVQPSGARPPIMIALAIVRWKQGDRFGLEFVRFEGNSKQQLEDMLNQRDGSPAD